MRSRTPPAARQPHCCLQQKLSWTFRQPSPAKQQLAQQSLPPSAYSKKCPLHASQPASARCASPRQKQLDGTLLPGQDPAERKPCQRSRPSDSSIAELRTLSARQTNLTQGTTAALHHPPHDCLPHD